MIRKHRNRTSATSNGRRASNSSAPKTAKRNTQAHSPAPGSVGSKPKTTIKQQPKNALTKSAAQSSTASKPKTVPKSTQPNRSRTPQSVPQNFGNKQKTTPKDAPQKATAAPIGTAAPEKSRREQEYEYFDSNLSAVIPRGRTFQTRDEFVQGGDPKEEYEDKPEIFYRTVIVVDTNDLDELAVVKQTSSPKGIKITVGKREIGVRPFIHTLDDEKNPIKKGKKFIENPASRDIPEEETERIKKKAIRNQEAYKALHTMKKRHKKQESK